MINRVEQEAASGDIPTWAHRRKSFDPWVQAFINVASRIWTKLSEKRQTYYLNRDIQSFRYLDDRTLRDIGISRADASRMSWGPEKPASEPSNDNIDHVYPLAFESSVFSKQAS
jgi:uncharacterized protein YjiS (DUF1127 family)